MDLPRRLPPVRWQNLSAAVEQEGQSTYMAQTSWRWYKKFDAVIKFGACFIVSSLECKLNCSSRLYQHLDVVSVWCRKLLATRPMLNNSALMQTNLLALKSSNACLSYLSGKWSPLDSRMHSDDRS